MVSFIEELYFGNISPYAKCFDRNSEYAKFIEIVTANEEKLNAFLDGEEKHLFSQLMNAQGEILDTGERERFIEGFQLGARLILDTLLIPQNSVIKGIC